MSGSDILLEADDSLGAPINKVVCLFNIDFGAPYGFGIDEYYRVKILNKKGYLRKYLCRDKKKGYITFDYSKIARILPFGNLFPRFLTILERITDNRLSTNQMNKTLIDMFASFKIDSELGILYTTLDFSNTIQKAKKMGYVVVISMGPHPKWILETTKLENMLMNNQKENPAWRKGILERQLVSLENADYVIVPSQFAKKTLTERACKCQIFVNPLGAKIEKFSYNDRKDDSRGPIKFLFMADMTIMKGLQYLLEAWSQLRLADAELIICGKIGCDVEKTVLKYRHLKGLVFLGHVKNPENFYNSSSVFVFPSLIEAMARVVIEAMASGLPVIVTPNSGSVIIDYKEGFNVPAGDVQALKDKILYFYNNRAEVHRMGKNARKKAESLSWQNNSIRTASIINAIWRKEHNPRNLK